LATVSEQLRCSVLIQNSPEYRAADKLVQVTRKLVNEPTAS
jgi:hypothetical protein